MKKNILLINPWIYDFAAYDFWVKPLGLFYIASILRLNGYHLNIIDCQDSNHPHLEKESHIEKPRIYPSGRGRFPKETIRKPECLKNYRRNYNRYGITPYIFSEELKACKKPDLIFVTSMMTYWYPGVFEVIRIVKKHYPGIPVVLGGIYATLCREHALHSGADLVISGEGEKHIRPILNDLLGDDPAFIPGPENIDSMPYPAFDLVPLKNHLPILTSRGCPFRCTYCASPIC